MGINGCSTIHLSTGIRITRRLTLTRKRAGQRNVMTHSRQFLAPLILFFGVAAALGHGLSDLPLQIRSSSQVLNFLAASVLAWALPAALAWLAIRARAGYVKVSMGILAAVFAFASLAFSVLVFVGFIIDTGISRELISEAKLKHAHYRLYRTDCGATCAVGLELHKEYDLPLGMKVISPAWSLYRESDGTVSVEGSTIQVRKGHVVMWEQSQ